MCLILFNNKKRVMRSGCEVEQYRYFYYLRIKSKTILK